MITINKDGEVLINGQKISEFAKQQTGSSIVNKRTIVIENGKVIQNDFSSNEISNLDLNEEMNELEDLNDDISDFDELHNNVIDQIGTEFKTSKIKCRYCGSVYKSSKTDCPNCGANNNSF